MRKNEALGYRRRARTAWGGGKIRCWAARARIYQRHPTMKTRILTLALLVCVLTPLEAASLRLGRRYKDETNGFQISPPNKWEQVPTKFQEVAIVPAWLIG